MFSVGTTDMPQAYIALGASGCLIMIRYDATDMDLSYYDCVSSNVVFYMVGFRNGIKAHSPRADWTPSTGKTQI